ncbi:hypothetical protein HQQ81_07940 [Microbacteriaceae bacterium VKM Ac-2854]|nr:hypothetical protein [Microbacteriaceae bacterium VKM Ac-2854]
MTAKTPQQLDPLGALDAWPVALFCALIAVVGSFISAIASAVDARPVLTVTLSFLLLLASMVLVAINAHPSRAPFARSAFAVALVLATASAVAGIAAERVLTAPSLWAPYALALFFLATASYRSGRELVAYGSVATAAVVLSGVITAEATGSGVAGMLLAGMVVGTPVLGASLGAAAYARSYARSVSGWRERAGREARDFAGDQHERLAADVHENVLGVLNREMLPFFRRLLEKDAIAEDDSGNARAVADVVRRIIVAENDRSWLDHVLVREWRGAAEQGFDPKSIVQDPERIVDEVEGTARAALMAYVILVLRRGAHPEDAGLRVRAFSSGSGRTIEIGVASSVFNRRGRTELRPYLSVLYATFDAVAITRASEQLTLRLTYGHPNDR